MSGPFPEDSAARKTYPMYSGVLSYFPAALAAVSHHSYLGNEKHNPGEALHWARGKSDDHLDAAVRHLTEGDLRGAAWRILAALQIEEEANGAPMAPGARNVPPPTTEETSVLFDIDPALLAQIEQQLAADDPDPESAMGLNVANATPPDSDGHPLSHTAGEATFNAPLNPVSQRDEE